MRKEGFKKTKVEGKQYNRTINYLSHLSEWTAGMVKGYLEQQKLGNCGEQ